MMKNRVYYKGIILFIALLFVFPFLNAQTETKPKPKTLAQFNTATGALNSVKGEITRQMIKLNQYFTLREKQEFIKKHIDEKIYQRKADGTGKVVCGYNEAFNKFQETYENLSADDRSKVNSTYFGTSSSEKFNFKNTTVPLPLPDAGSVFFVR